MFTSRLLVSVAELLVMIVVSAVIIEVIYRVFLRANPDFSMEEEIRKGNAAVGILVAVIMICAAMMLQKGLVASLGNLRLSVVSPQEAAFPFWQALLLLAGHFVLSLASAVLTISFTLRLFGRLTRRINPEMKLGVHLREGNVAVGVILAAVVFIATLYVGEGVSALTKALVPQPKIGKIRIME